MKTRPRWLGQLTWLYALAGVGWGVVLWVVFEAIHLALFDLHSDLVSSAHIVTLLFEFAFFVLAGLVFQFMTMRSREVEGQVRKLSRAVEQSPSGVMITDLRGVIEYVNPKFTEMTGYTLEDVRGKTPAILNSGQMPDATYQDMWRTIKAGGEWRGEFLNRKKNGDLYWEFQSISPIVGADGRPTHYVAVKENITVRKAVEDAVQAARQFLQATLDAMPASIAVLDETGAIIAVNAGWRQFADANALDDPAYGVGTSYLAVCDAGTAGGDVTARAAAEAIRQMLNGAIERFQTEYPCHSPTVQRWFMLRMSRYVIDGDVRILVGHFNITERVHAEQVSREQRALAEALRDTAAVLNSTLDVDTVLKHILDAVEQVVPHDVAVIMLLDDQEQVRVTHVRDRLHLGREQALLQVQWHVRQAANMRRVMQTGQADVIADTHADPEWIKLPETEWIRSNATMPIMKQGEVIGFLTLESAEPDHFTPEHAEHLQAFVNQVALALRNAELFDTLEEYARTLEDHVSARTAELEFQRAQLRAILEGLGEGVVYTQGTNVVYANQALLALLGYAEQEFPGDVFEQGVSVFKTQEMSFDQMRSEVSGAFARGKTWRKQVTVERQDGSAFRAALTVAPVWQADGDVAGTVTIVRDVSLEHDLQARKTRFLTHAAHELRTPITNLKTRLYLMRQQPLDNIERHVDVLDAVARVMTTLMDDLLDILRLELRPQDIAHQMVNVQPLLARLVAARRPVAEGYGMHIVFDAPETGDFTVCGDTRRLEQALTRLFDHLIRHAAAGSVLTVHIAHDTAPSGNTVVLRLRDSNGGISADDLDQVFEPFFSTSEANFSGVGLGLALAHEIVRLHGGTLTVEPVPDADAASEMMFVVRLPAGTACGD